MTGRRRWLWILVAVVVIVLAIVLITSLDKGSENIDLVEVTPGKIAKTLSLRGRSMPAASSQVTALVEGFVDAVVVKLDQPVEVGQVLAKINLAPAMLLKVHEAVAAYHTALAGREQQVSAVIDSPAPARILRILVKPGQRVKSGQALASIALDPAYLEKLDNLALEIGRLELSEAKLAREVAANRELVKKDLMSKEALEAAETELARTKEALGLRQSQQERLGRQLKRKSENGSNEALLLSPRTGRVLRILKEEGQLVSPGENGALLYLARGDGAGEALDKAQAGRLDISLSRLRQAESQLKALSALTGQSYLEGEVDLGRGFARSQIAGVVTWINLNLAKGYNFHPGEPLFKVEDLSSLLVVCRVHEIDFPQIVPGQSVEVFFDAFPDEPFQAALAGRPKAARSKFEDPFTEYQVVFTLGNPDKRLLGGLSAEVIVHLADREAEMTLPSSCIFQSGGQSLVFLVNKGRLEKRQVELGLRGDERVEVIGGIKPGDKVVLFPEQVNNG